MLAIKSVGAEYTHTEYGLADLGGEAICQCSGTTQTAVQASNRSVSADAVRLVVNYRFRP